jgi:hypothetical protein
VLVLELMLAAVLVAEALLFARLSGPASTHRFVFRDVVREGEETQLVMVLELLLAAVLVAEALLSARLS